MQETGFSWLSPKSEILWRLILIFLFLSTVQTNQGQRTIWIRLANFLSAPTKLIVTSGTNVSMQLESKQVSSYQQILLAPSSLNTGLAVTVGGSAFLVGMNGYMFSRYTLVAGDLAIGGVGVVSYNDLTWTETGYNITSPYDVNTLWRIVALPLGVTSYTFYSMSHDCLNCGFLPINVNYSTSYKLDNSISLKDLKMQYTVEGQIVTKRIAENLSFDSQGIYTLFVDTQSGQLVSVVDQEPEPFWGALSLLGLYFLLVFGARLIYKRSVRHRPKNDFRERRSLKTKRSEESLRYNRIDALDTLRGLAVLLLLFFKAGGGNFTFFNESLWEGFTYADLPEFIIAWIMGFTIPLTYKNQLLFGNTKLENIKSVLFRGVLTFFAGLITNRNQNLESSIVNGYLQHLSLAYILIGSLYMFLPTERRANSRRKMSDPTLNSPVLKLKQKDSPLDADDWNKKETLSLGFSRSSKDSGPSHRSLKSTKKHPFVPYMLQWNVRIRTFIVILVGVAAYLMLKLVAAPGCPVGYTNPGGIADNGQYPTCTAGLTGFIDMRVFGVHHLPAEPACKYLYYCQAFSRYSIMSIFNFLVAVYLGLMAGESSLCYRTKKHKLAIVILIAFTCAVIAIFLTAVPGPQRVPVSKALWSISYVLLANVFTCLVYFFIKLLFDQRLASGWPFKAAGLNTFALLLTSGMVNNRFPLGFQNSGSHIEMLCSNLLGVTVWGGLALILHKYRFYIKY